MSNWEQRGNYLIEVAQRCLRGHKTFDLCRSHLVKASKISKGTIYNHFTSEADLIVAVACADYSRWLTQAKEDEFNYSDPLKRILFHHCWRLRDTLSNQRFVIERVMPNTEILSQATEYYRHRFEKLHSQYEQWNKALISQIGDVAGFDRAELVVNYLRGAMINSDDANKHSGDVQMYYQFSYALTHLMGHSEKRIPTKLEFTAWLSAKNQLHYQQNMSKSVA